MPAFSSAEWWMTIPSTISIGWSPSTFVLCSSPQKRRSRTSRAVVALSLRGASLLIGPPSRGLARALGPRAITVNVIQPGPTETDMNANPAVIDTLRTLMAIGRMGKDVEIASLVAYLASPPASFITGSAITIDGGYLA
jgi:NAD(P)-dependent dehydrogenase (short-subunit alcohol dehydrogenase family)